MLKEIKAGKVKHIAMIGPGYGHNIQPWLKGLNDDNEVQLSMFYHGKDQYSSTYTSSGFYKVTSAAGVVQLLSNLRKYDIIWQMSGRTFLYFIPFLFLFTRKACKSILHVWGEKLPRSTNGSSLKSKITRLFVGKYDIINCNWYGTASLFAGQLREKVVVQPMGLTSDYFEREDSPGKEMQTIINGLEPDRFNFFYPKSFSYSSRQDLVIEAAAALRDGGITGFAVYFWEGNVVEVERKKKLLESIDALELHDYVRVIKKDRFYSYSDMSFLWDNMNCGLQIAQNDQLSNTVFEPLIYGKDIVISDIAPYQNLESYFGFSLELTSLTTEAVLGAMEGMIDGRLRVNPAVKSDRKEKIEQKYAFDNRYPEILARFV